MLLTRTPPNVVPLGRALLYTHTTSSSALLVHRQFHISSTRRQDVRGGGGKVGEGPSSSKYPHPVLSEKRSEPGWSVHHEGYSDEDMNNVKIVHHKREKLSDWVAAFMVGVARTGFDLATNYPKHRERFPRVAGTETREVQVGFPKAQEQHKKSVALAKGKAVQSDDKDLPETMELGEMRKRGLCFGPEAWLVRMVFLESIAGVPGMVAASLRHLHSLRLLRRDKGWIKTLLDESQNERMHLLSALELYKPGPLMRGLLLLAQGVFYNFFFIFYLISSRTAHRFVGTLEEEAVVTYSRIIDDIQEGRLPEWEHLGAPKVAIDYWGLKDDAKMLDMIRAIRLDEAGHRYVNHTLAELKTDDYNPFSYGEPPKTRGLTWGLTRDEAISYFEAAEANRVKRLHSPQSSHDASHQDHNGSSSSTMNPA